jgi:hypothetical protein
MILDQDIIPWTYNSYTVWRDCEGLIIFKNMESEFVPEQEEHYSNNIADYHHLVGEFRIDGWRKGWTEPEVVVGTFRGHNYYSRSEIDRTLKEICSNKGFETSEFKAATFYDATTLEDYGQAQEKEEGIILVEYDDVYDNIENCE